MKICIFEDNEVYNLSPINYLRHTSEITCSALTLFEKISRLIKGRYEITLHSRGFLKEYLSEKHISIKVNQFTDDEYLFLNSRVIFNKTLINYLINYIKNNKNVLWEIDDVIIAFNTSGKFIKNLESELVSQDNIIKLNLKRIDFRKIVVKEVKSSIPLIINYPWELIYNNGVELPNDLKFLLISSRGKNNIINRIKKVNLINKKDIYISKGSIIHNNVCLNAERGPIYISHNVIIEPFTYIEGPVFIGDRTLIKSGTNIYGPTSIGSFSKVAGEITSSILHSFVNKQHYGFLGHSYLCEWVNLGAGTTTSNLKNNYREITVNFKNRKINTNSIFLGSIIGDHTKTGICTLLNTGSLIGIFTNLIGRGYQDKTINSFLWSNSDIKLIEQYDINKAIETARTVMKRRNIAMSRSYEDLVVNLFNRIEDLII